MRAPAFFLFCMSLIAASESMANECGDINGDGSVDVLDIVGTVTHVVGTSTLEGEQFCPADTNADGAINVLDIVALVYVILNP